MTTPVNQSHQWEQCQKLQLAQATMPTISAPQQSHDPRFCQMTDTRAEANTHMHICFAAVFRITPSPFSWHGRCIALVGSCNTAHGCIYYNVACGWSSSCQTEQHVRHVDSLKNDPLPQADRLLRELSPGPLAPEQGIMPLDQAAFQHGPAQRLVSQHAQRLRESSRGPGAHEAGDRPLDQ